VKNSYIREVPKMTEQRLHEYCDEVKEKGICTLSDEVEAMQVENQLRKEGIRTSMQGREGVWQVQMIAQGEGSWPLLGDKLPSSEELTLAPLIERVNSIQSQIKQIVEKLDKEGEELYDRIAEGHALLLRWVEISTQVTGYEQDGRAQRLALLHETQAFLIRKEEG
jgi:hypothetical protein